MAETELPRKRVVVHVGPHKTGSTAIQHSFKACQKELFGEGVHFLHDTQTHEIAACLAQEKVEAAEASLRELSAKISRLEAHTILLSQEDFCGDLPGRSGGRSIYPKLTRNLRTIANCLQPHATEFVLFLREEQEWLQSCYHQNLQHRTRFSSLESFVQFLDAPLVWEEKLHRPRRVFGTALHVVPYSKDRDAGMQSILKLLKVGKTLKDTSIPEINPSPSAKNVRLLERVNTLSSFKSTAWFSKTLIVTEWQPRPKEEINFPRPRVNTLLAVAGLPELSKRSVKRIVRQQVSDVMPPADVDLASYVFDILPADATLPSVSRSKMEDQA